MKFAGINARNVMPKPNSGMLLGMVFLMLCRVAFAGSVDPDGIFVTAMHNNISSAKPVAVAETNFENMLRQYSNSPRYLGGLHVAMAFRYSYELNWAGDHIIEQCEDALRYPLDGLDTCRTWQLLGDTLKRRMNTDAPARQLPVFRRKALAAYLNGLTAAGADQNLSGWLKGCVVRLYANNPYFE